LESVDIVKYPTKIQIYDILPEGGTVTSIAGGGRHTALAARLGDEVLVLGWGRGTSGELGSPILEEVRRPRAIVKIPQVMESEVSISCGWEHTAIVSPNSVVGFQLMSGATQGFSLIDFLRSWLGDIDASFAQLVNGIVLLKFINPAGRSKAALYTTAISNLMFSIQAWARGGTSLPHGVNTVALFSLNTQVYNPVLLSTGSIEKATSAMLFCTIVLGLFQLVASIGLAQLVAKHIPQAALLACVAGIALVYIATNFSAQMFAESHASFAPFMIFLIGFLSRERMPFGIPVAAVALAAGWLLSTGAEEGLLSNVYHPDEVIVSPYDAMMDSSNYPYVFTVIIPLFIVTIVGNLACVEQARASGDEYSASVSLGLDSLATLLGALVFGSCVPTCIYLGSVGFKQWGATHWYTVIVSTILFLLAFEYQPLVTLLGAIPRVAAVGMLVYVGLVVTGDAFKLKKHVASVVFGLVPAVASFAIQPSEISFPESHNPYEVLGKGYLILSIIFASTAALLCERRFIAATVWLLIAGSLTLSGLIHERQTQDCFVGYLSGACVTALWAVAQWHRGEREGDHDSAEKSLVDLAAEFDKTYRFRAVGQRNGTRPLEPDSAANSSSNLWTTSPATKKDASYGSV
jgi:AGZA family xanthine/uracil permease-like MFS transporter